MYGSSVDLIEGKLRRSGRLPEIHDQRVVRALLENDGRYLRPGEPPFDLRIYVGQGNVALADRDDAQVRVDAPVQLVTEDQPDAGETGHQQKEQHDQATPAMQPGQLPPERSVQRKTSHINLEQCR